MVWYFKVLIVNRLTNRILDQYYYVRTAVSNSPPPESFTQQKRQHVRSSRPPEPRYGSHDIPNPATGARDETQGRNRFVGSFVRSPAVDRSALAKDRQTDGQTAWIAAAAVSTSFRQTAAREKSEKWKHTTGKGK